MCTRHDNTCVLNDEQQICTMPTVQCCRGWYTRYFKELYNKSSPYNVKYRIIVVVDLVNSLFIDRCIQFNITQLFCMVAKSHKKIEINMFFFNITVFINKH